MDNGQRLSSSDDGRKETISLSKIKVISTISDLAKNLSTQGEEENNYLVGVNSHSSVSKTYPKAMSFTWFDILLNLVSIFCYLVDIISDITLACVHYKTNHFVFFYLTLVFIIVPTLITNCVSLRWYLIDARNESNQSVSKSRWIVRSFFLILQMGQVMRYIDSLLFGIKYMNKPDVKYYQAMVHEDTDATMLRLFECFLESAPQLLIQLYLIIIPPVSTTKISNSDMLFYVLFPYFSCCISLFSIALALASYYKSLRMSLPNKVNLSMIEMGVQITWRLLMLSSRILALTLFITSFDYFIVFVLFVHWIIMFSWILTMKTNFCENMIEEVLYDALVAIMFIFCFFNPIDNDTRERYAFFFTFMFVENTFLLYFWSRNCVHRYNFLCEYKIELIVLYYVFFITGILVMIFYYLSCHPSKRIKICRSNSDLELNKQKHSYASRNQQRRVFDERDWATENEIEGIKNHLSQIDGLDVVDIKQIGKVRQVLKQTRAISQLI